MRNIQDAFILTSNLKQLTGRMYPSEVALFDELVTLGVTGLGNYRSGGRNKNIARRHVLRYLEYQKAEVTPGAKKKRSYIVTEVYDQPRESEDKRGRSGRYIDRLGPMIVHTRKFNGSRAELFYDWGVYKPYIKIEKRSRNNPSDYEYGYRVSPWRITDGMKPGEEKYRTLFRVKEKSSLEMALNSLQQQGILKWEEYYVYNPVFETQEEGQPRRSLTRQELREKCNKGFDWVSKEAEKENCVLKTELYYYNMVLNMQEWTYQIRKEHYYVGNQRPIIYEADSEQVEMYENYRRFIRQLTVYVCNGSEGAYCPEDEIPNEYEIFSDFTYSKQYRRLDEQYRRECLGWEKVWKQIRFEVINQEKAEKLLQSYHVGLAFELGREYALYVDSQMEKNTKGTQIYFCKEDEDDFSGIIAKEMYGRLVPLKTSKSAKRLHAKIKEAYGL